MQPFPSTRPTSADSTHTVTADLAKASKVFPLSRLLPNSHRADGSFKIATSANISEAPVVCPRRTNLFFAFLIVLFL